MLWNRPPQNDQERSRTRSFCEGLLCRSKNTWKSRDKSHIAANHKVSRFQFYLMYSSFLLFNWSYFLNFKIGRLFLVKVRDLIFFSTIRLLRCAIKPIGFNFHVENDSTWLFILSSSLNLDIKCQTNFEVKTSRNLLSGEIIWNRERFNLWFMNYDCSHPSSKNIIELVIKTLYLRVKFYELTNTIMFYRCWSSFVETTISTW